MEKTWSPAQMAALPAVPASRVDVLGREPVWSSSLAQSSNGSLIALMDNSTDSILVVNRKKKEPWVEIQKNSSARVEQLEGASRLPRELSKSLPGPVELSFSGLKLLRGKNQELWTLPWGFSAVDVQYPPKTDTLVAWSVAPPRLMFVRSSLRGATRWNWNSGGEPLALIPCDRNGRAVLVENLSQGLTRLVWFKHAEPTGQTLFDFTPDQSRKSEVVAAHAYSCSDVLLFGPLGTRRVLFSGGVR